MYLNPAPLVRPKTWPYAGLIMVWREKHSPAPSVEIALVKTFLKSNFTISIRTKNDSFMKARA